MSGDTTTQPDWFLASFALYLAQLKQARLEREAEDPGVPAYRTEDMGYTSPAPVSFVAGMHKRIPSVFNLDKLHRRVLELLGVKPA